MKGILTSGNFWSVVIILISCGLVLYSMINTSKKNMQDYQLSLKRWEATNTTTIKLAELVKEEAQEVKELRKMNDILREQNEILKKQNDRLKTNHNEVVKTYNYLQKENDNLRAILEKLKEEKVTNENESR